MKSLFPIIVLLSCTISCRTEKKKDEPEHRYAPDYASLAHHNQQPDWFQDAKLGIYFHWGVYSVPAFGNEWYPSRMHHEDDIIYKHHLEKYGHPSEFGYHDFVPMFKAAHFDAKEWAVLFKRAGARFAGPVAEHHDGYSMWASKITPWNTLDTGPKRDITGELEKAIRSQGMKLITTFHHAKHLQRFDSIPEEGRKRAYRNSHYPYYAGMPTRSDDERLKYLYGNIPEEQWLEEVWLGKLKEVIDNYQPDIIWFDSWLDRIPESKRKEFAAYYLNEADKWGKEVVIIRKQDDLPLDFSLNDLEKSRMNKLGEQSWMTDETISYGSWCYTENLRIKPTKDVLHVLIDIVSKNGVLLLNISPMADGTIPENQREVLLELGAWLDAYGEAVYETRPWITYGEGPTKEPEGHFKNHNAFSKLVYSNKDLRYTTRGNIIYATIFGWPDEKKVVLESFGKDRLAGDLKVHAVSLVGYEGDLNWEVKDNGLEISMPDKVVNEMAIVFKLDTEGSASLVKK
ncbi:MAG: alpha-L-fucosidase [Cytophagales bacterium]|nr:alpha-L-fucosidase [Cytophagales bacterium]